MTIQLDRSISDRLNQGMKLGDAIELPFPVVYFWAMNGQTAYKGQGGAMYFGGWACKQDQADEVMEKQGLPAPALWKPVDIATREGDEFAAYTTRYLLIAPIAQRESWLGKDGLRHSHYVDGARRHLQVLCYTAEKQGENYVPWGPVVLTAKGYQALNLLDAFGKWNKAVSPVLRKVAPGVPAWCFYLAVGTFDKERKVSNVGKSGAQSPITPVGAYIPDGITEEKMLSLFVGSDTAAIMVDLLEQAEDWRNAWKNDGKAKNGNGSGEDDQFVYGDNVAPEDEIQF